jgi:hypothetical protein
MTPPDELFATPTIRAATSARTLISAVLVAGALTAVFWRPGVILLLTGVAGGFASQLVVGAAAYRAAMRRPLPPTFRWHAHVPGVRPLDDDEDDW